MSLEITKSKIFPLIGIWATAESVKVLWPNQEWNNSNTKPTDTQLWLEVFADNTYSGKPCLGEPWERDEGIITIVLYHPLGVAIASGRTKTGTQLAEDLKTALQQKQIDKTVTFTGSVSEGGRDADLPFWRYNIFIPFRTDNLTGAKP